MKKLLFPFAAICLLASCAGTGGSTATDSTAMNDGSVAPNATAGRGSMDYYGMYEGTIACADCEGQYTILTLNDNNSYTVRTKYMGKNDTFYSRTGNYTWDDASGSVTLDGEGGRYRVSNGELMMLDSEGRDINSSNPSAYRLKRGSGMLDERHWKLIEVNGQAVTMAPGMRRDPYLTFHSKDGRVAGFSGCNNVTGTYTTNIPNRINFSKMVSTRMACADGVNETEKMMVRALESSNTYMLRNDTLMLQAGEGAPTAKFAAVYMR